MGNSTRDPNGGTDPVAGTSATLIPGKWSNPASSGRFGRVLLFAAPRVRFKDGKSPRAGGQSPPSRPGGNDDENRPLSFLEDGLGAVRGIGAAIAFVGAFLLMALFILWISAKMGIGN